MENGAVGLGCFGGGEAGNEGIEGLLLGPGTSGGMGMVVSGLDKGERLGERGLLEAVGL